MSLDHKTVLSDKDISNSVSNGEIVIEPFNPENQLGNCSYDVTLGENYYSSVQTHKTIEKTWSLWGQKQRFVNPYDQVSIDNFWGPSRVAENSGEKGVPEFNIPPNTKYIVLQPRELILAHTQEFIGGVKNITTMMKGRSSSRRCGYSLCGDAGWGDCGYINRWTLEIENHTDVPIVLYVGQKVAQIVFFPTGECTRNYASKGSYQTTDNLAELKESWTPSMMLPVAKTI